jgi:hypothetical protein
MSYSINPYVLKINELNKELEGLKLDKSCGFFINLIEHEINEIEQTLTIIKINLLIKLLFHIYLKYKIFIFIKKFILKNKIKINKI